MPDATALNNLNPFNFDNDINDEVRQRFFNSIWEGVKESGINPDDDGGQELLNSLTCQLVDSTIGILRESFATHVESMQAHLKDVSYRAALAQRNPGLFLQIVGRGVRNR